jgi:hypothetical protein
VTIIEALKDASLLGRHFPGDTWRPGFTALGALFGLPLDAEVLDLFRKHTGRQTPPTEPVREAWLICGRRSGKSRLAAALAVYLATFHGWQKHLAPGERAVVMLLATDRDQASIVFGFIAALIDETRRSRSWSSRGRRTPSTSRAAFRSRFTRRAIARSEVEPSSLRCSTRSRSGEATSRRTPTARC